jgi:hypothetical protein
MNNRPKCKIEGCCNVATKIYSKKHKKQYYRSLCGKHYEIHYGIREQKRLQRGAIAHGFSVEQFTEIKMSACSLCGWNKASCDIHRIVNGKDGGKYIKENIIVLCPNCHRLVHRGLIKI